MSKITQEKKALKGKQKKIADAQAKKEADGSVKKTKQKTSVEGMKNVGCCCTCKHFPHKSHGETMPCQISGKYVARKAKFNCYKCKFEA